MTMPSEALKIGKARMCADADAARLRRAHGRVHHVRIARMQAAGDIGRGHHLHQRGVIADAPAAIALPQIGVEINPAHASVSSPVSSCPAVTPEMRE